MSKEEVGQFVNNESLNKPEKGDFIEESGEKIKEIAQRIYEQRMSGKGRKPNETVDKILEEQGLKPWTPEAEEFMKKWDWEQAEKMVKSHSQEEFGGKKELKTDENAATLETPSEKKGIKTNEIKPDVFKIESSLGEARGAYISCQRKYSQNIPLRRASVRRAPEELRKSEAEYDKAKILYAKEMRSLKMAELEKSGKNKEELEKEFKKFQAEIFKRIIIDEHNLLLETKIESLVLKEKSIIRKGLDLWMRQGRSTRILISTALITGLSIATGGAAAAGIGSASLFAGSRYVKGFASALAAQGIGKGVDWVFSKAFIEKVQKEAVAEEAKAGEELSSGELTLEKIRKIEINHRRMVEKLSKLERKKTLIKGAAMVITGAGASIGLNWLESAYGGGFKSSFGASEEPLKSSVEMPPEDYNKFKPYEDVSTKHNVEALEEAAQTKAETILEDHNIENLATIKPGEGAWNAVYRQLENQLERDPAKFDFKPENLDNAEKFKFLTRETNKILIDNGYIKSDGSEIRIAKPGIKVFLNADNKISVDNGNGKLTYEWMKSKIEIAPAPHPDNLEAIPEAPAQEIVSEAPNQGMIYEKSEFSPDEPMAPEEVINTTPETASTLKIVENIEFGAKGTFKYSPDGKITDFSTSGTASLWEAKNLLNEDWRGILIEKGFSGMHAGIIENRAGLLLNMKRVLKTLAEVGKENSEEAIYLNEKIKGIINSTEAMYGDVFK